MQAKSSQEQEQEQASEFDRSRTDDRAQLVRLGAFSSMYSVRYVRDASADANTMQQRKQLTDEDAAADGLQSVNQ